MSKRINYKLLLRTLNLPEYIHHDLKIALTHKTFEKHTTESKNGSRYVFLGQTAFKGRVAEVLFEYVSGTGTQLQHYWGNLFKNNNLERLFNQFDLMHLIRFGEHFDWRAHKHIFTYALLGFLHDFMEDEALKKFIYKYFIKNSSHLLPKSTSIKKDYKSQAYFLCKSIYGVNPKLDISKKGDEYWGKIIVKDLVLCETDSRSYKYLNKKIWKMVLKSLASLEESKLLQDEAMVLRFKERAQEESEKAEQDRRDRIKKHQEKQLIRSERIRTQKAKRKLEAEKKDYARRLAKIRSKERKEQLAEQKRRESLALQNLSGAKRRLLEDRGILSKKQ